MQTFDLLTLLLILSAIFAYINSRYFHLPATIGFMIGSLVLSLCLLGLKALGITFATRLIATFEQIDYSTTVLNGILSFLLFAGALQLDIADLSRHKGMILSLATLGVVLSTFIVGSLTYCVFHLCGIPLSYLLALTFGALISPTDPVVVVALFRRTHIDSRIKMTVMGEALFNDGVAIVLFVVFSTLAFFTTQYTVQDITFLLVQQIVGSAVLGLVFGWITHYLLWHTTGYSNQVLVTLGMVACGYDLALLLNVSGPITTVIQGLFVRNFKENHPSARRQFEPLYNFWSFNDELLNAALFLLMGLEVLSLKYRLSYLIAGGITILITLFARYVSVWLPLLYFRLTQELPRRLETVLTWTGLRGGISLALALSLPEHPFNNALLTATYLVVLFSVVVQGLTSKPLLKWTTS